MFTNKGFFGCVRDSSVSALVVSSDNALDAFLLQDLLEDAQRGAVTTRLFGEALPHGNESRSRVGARDRDRATNAAGDAVGDNRHLLFGWEENLSVRERFFATAKSPPNASLLP